MNKQSKTMNENLNLIEILEDCPKGTKLYSTLFGDVELERVCKIENNIFTYPIEVKASDGATATFTKDGMFCAEYSGECILFPSKDQRDWSKFTAPWLKKGKFDPKTLKPFDKVLVRDNNLSCWRCAFYSHQRETEGSNSYRYVTTASSYIYCIPYNEDTKHLLGTSEEAPEYYRYWEE